MITHHFSRSMRLRPGSVSLAAAPARRTLYRYRRFNEHSKCSSGLSGNMKYLPVPAKAEAGVQGAVVVDGARR